MVSKINKTTELTKNYIVNKLHEAFFLFQFIVFYQRKKSNTFVLINLLNKLLENLFTIFYEVAAINIVKVEVL